MNSQEFIKNAIKTESVVEHLNVDKTILIETLRLFVLCSELLDGIKKQAFYNNPKKANEKTLLVLNEMMSAVYSIGYNFERINGGIIDQEVPENVNTRIAHGIIGIATESGELAECFLKALEHDEPIDIVNMSEELFDGDWYKAVISDECEIDWEEWWQRIIDKLRARFGEAFSEERANSRNLEKEREILENK